VAPSTSSEGGRAGKTKSGHRGQSLTQTVGRGNARQHSGLHNGDFTNYPRRPQEQTQWIWVQRSEPHPDGRPRQCPPTLQPAQWRANPRRPQEQRCIWVQKSEPHPDSRPRQCPPTLQPAQWKQHHAGRKSKVISGSRGQCLTQTVGRGSARRYSSLQWRPGPRRPQEHS